MIDESKMYVVIGVLLIILLGLFVYLISMDIKLRKLEKMSRRPDNDQAEAGQSTFNKESE